MCRTDTRSYALQETASFKPGVHHRHTWTRWHAARAMDRTNYVFHEYILWQELGIST